MQSHTRTAILIGGMHRTGTSSIAGVVHRLGAGMPRTLLPPLPENPRGFFESQRIMALNDRIFAETGTHWTDWRSFDVDWAAHPKLAHYLAEAAALLGEEYGDANLIAIKDPRFSRLLPLWKLALEARGYRVCTIIPIRHPDETAASLLQRQGMSAGRARLLWARHMLEVEFFSRGMPRIFVNWIDFLRDWEHESRRIARCLGIAWPNRYDEARSEVVAFLSADLRHHEAHDSVAAAADIAVEVYRALVPLARDSAADDGTARMDAIRTTLARAELTYGPICAELQEQLTAANTREAAVSGRLSAAADERNGALDVGRDLAARLVRLRARRFAAFRARDEALQARDAALAQAARERAAAAENARLDRLAWDRESAAQRLRIEELERFAAATRAQSRLLAGRLAELRSLSPMRKLIAVLRNDEAFFDDELIYPLLDAQDATDRPILPSLPAELADDSLSGLLRCHGVDFLNAVYAALLRRPPDPTGREFYLHRLLRGTPKIQIIAEVALSQEARGIGMQIPGLSGAIWRYRLCRLPLLGGFLRLFFKVEGNSAAERRLRAIEQTLYAARQ